MASRGDEAAANPASSSPHYFEQNGGGGGGSQSRVELLRQKLEQYNAGIARAMNNLAAQAAASSSSSSPPNGAPPPGGSSGFRNVGPGAAPLVPPSLSGVRPLASTNRPVERDLASEFVSRSRSGNDGGPSLDDGNVSHHSSLQNESSNLSNASGGLGGPNAPTSAAYVYDVDDATDEDDEDEFEEARSEQISTDDDAAANVPLPPPPPRAAAVPVSRGPPSASPMPDAPTYVFNDLETSYHRVNAVQDCAKVLLSFPAVVLTPMQDDRARLLLEAREQILSRDRALRDERESLLSHRSSSLRSAEDDVQAVIQNLLTEADEARKCFSAVYERKAVLYAKEKQLEQLGNELQRMHQAVQNRRSSVATIEARVEQRRRALKRREEAFQQTLSAHSSREEELRKKVEQVEELNKKVVSWIKILESREMALSTKEQRLKGVQSELQHRVASLHR